VIGHRCSKNRTGVLVIGIYLDENEAVALLKPFLPRNKLKRNQEERCKEKERQD